MKFRIQLILLFAVSLSLAPASFADRMLVVQGADGDASFAEGFEKAAQLWEKLAEKADVELTLVKTPKDERSPRDQILDWIQNASAASQSSTWIVYLGHGSFGSDGAKLNLIGEDLSESDLAQSLQGLESDLIFIHGGAASGPFLPTLSGPNRIIITATRSGNEENYARFGEFFAQALHNERSDIDLDGRVSLLEAFVSASAAVETFYFEASRLTSEHALIDDNGDGRGTPASRFQGLRPKDTEDRDAVDGRSAKKRSLLPASGERLLTDSQIERRDKFEAELDQLHSLKSSLSEREYYEKLESILVELSKIYIETDSDS